MNNEAIAVLNKLKEGHSRFLSGHSIHPHANQSYLHELAYAQHPEVAILSCSDSRVPVELLFDSGFGDIFAVRNAGNACTPASIASLEYAVLELGVKLIIILGHERCGAISAACAHNPNLTPNLHELIEQIRNGLEQHQCADDADAACHQHPKITAGLILENSITLRKAISKHSIQIHTGCYILNGGTIDWQGAYNPSEISSNSRIGARAR